MKILNKKIVFLSGKKGGYDALKPFLINLKKKYKLKIIITDQHLNPGFGNTYKILQKDFSSKYIHKMKLKQKNDEVNSRLLAMSELIKKLSLFFKRENPDLLILYGDRGESLISAFVSVNYGTPILHFQGGDISGNIDEIFRHAITKLSNYHFCSNKSSRARIINMGENPKYVFNHGDNHLDIIQNKNKISKKNIINYLQIPNSFLDNFAIVHFHPETYLKSNNYHHMKKILLTLIKNKINIICIYPCNDQGYQGIIKAIKETKKKYPKCIKVFKILERDYFIKLLKLSKFLIGNSSSGIIEAPFLNKWSINIGSRQNMRLKSKFTLNSSASEKSIIKKIKFIYNNKSYRDPIYGNGISYKKNLHTLKKLIKNKKTLKYFYAK